MSAPSAERALERRNAIFPPQLLPAQHLPRGPESRQPWVARYSDIAESGRPPSTHGFCSSPDGKGKSRWSSWAWAQQGEVSQPPSPASGAAPHCVTPICPGLQV